MRLDKTVNQIRTYQWARRWTMQPITDHNAREEDGKGYASLHG